MIAALPVYVMITSHSGKCNKNKNTRKRRPCSQLRTLLTGDFTASSTPRPSTTMRPRNDVIANIRLPGQPDAFCDVPISSKRRIWREAKRFRDRKSAWLLGIVGTLTSRDRRIELRFSVLIREKASSNNRFNHLQRKRPWGGGVVTYLSTVATAFLLFGNHAFQPGKRSIVLSVFVGELLRTMAGL